MTTIKQNLITLLAAVKEQPTYQFALHMFKSHCGTIFCTAGLAATMPEFQEQGMHFPSPNSYVVFVGSQDVRKDGAADGIFGENAYKLLFCSRGFSKYDKELDLYNMSDKEVAINRLEQRIKETPNTISDNLRAGRELLSDASRWLQGFYAKDGSGSDCEGNEPGAACFCSVGAIQKVKNNDAHLSDEHEYLRKAVDGTSVVDYNDNHTHAEVLAMWDKAIELADKDGV